MTTVLPPISLTPFRDHFIRGRCSLSRTSPTSSRSLQSSSNSSLPVQPSRSKSSRGFAQPAADQHTASALNSDPPQAVHDPIAHVSSPFEPLDEQHAHHGYPKFTLHDCLNTSQVATDVEVDQIPLNNNSVRVAGSGDHDGSPLSRQAQRGLSKATEPFPKIAADTLNLEPHTSYTPVTNRNKRHRCRVSDASSAFVHTVKTASISESSFSIFGQSSKVDRSSDAQSSFVSPRYSVDSDRPVTRTSMEDAATARAVKRQQILEELTRTEDSYVADLKALLYLYSTLLITNCTLSNSLRTSMQRNVANLLHLHEDIVEKLHQAAFRSAARRWADTAVSVGKGPRNSLRWHSAGTHPIGQAFNKRCLYRTSIDSTETAHQYSSHVCAEAADVLDVATIFEAALPTLMYYEDYCANYELTTIELHKQLPLMCSTFEAGMESLARVLTAINEKVHQDRKGLTIGDLLIKPIQRICRYPLILSDLLQNIPTIDGPGAHEALENVLQRLRELVRSVNAATDDPETRRLIQRRVLLRDRLNLDHTKLSASDARELGRIQLCGVLHITYRAVGATDGNYALCVLFDSHFLIALPRARSGEFDIFALIELDDLTTRPPDDGNGLQCSSALFTFKLCFIVQDNIHEVLLSACSAIEEKQWLSGLEGDLRSSDSGGMLIRSMVTQVYCELRPIAKLFSSGTTASRQLTIQRAATVANRSTTCQVILRNTYNPQDLQEYRNSSSTSVGRSVSHATSVKTIVLAPKRSERVKLETSLEDIWTKNRLPYPRMIASKGSQILRASAGSLVRKLSLASIQAPFSRRSASATVSSKKSYDALTDTRKDPPMFTVRRQSLDGSTPIRKKRPQEIPELDTMENVIGRMIGGGTFGSKRLSFPGLEKAVPKGGIDQRRLSSCPIDPDGANGVLESGGDYDGNRDLVNEEVEARAGVTKSCKSTGVSDLPSSVHHRKHWSNPITKLKGLGTGGFKNILHHSK